MNDKRYNFNFETIINKKEDILNPFAYIILLGWVNNNHYVLLYPKNFCLNAMSNKIMINNNISI